MPPRSAPLVTVAAVAAALGARAVGPRTARADLVAEIRDVTHDSRTAAAGVLFACRPGASSDGHDHAPAAVAAGTTALLVERPLDLDVPQLAVPSVAAAMGPAAVLVHADPAADLDLIGVTGTNGKTTTAYLSEAILAADGRRTGLIGTVETRIAGRRVAGVRTTPEATDLVRLLAQMRAAGCTAAAMEVSSHGLALGRMDGTPVDVAVFTNLSQDHLDFHRDLDDYFAAKAQLFTPERCARAVICIDDEWGTRLAAEARVPVTTVSVTGRPADVRATDIELRVDGSRLRAHLPDAGALDLALAVPARFNVANALCALAACQLLGVPVAHAVAALATSRGAPGRMERVDAGQDVAVLVDYAHTPDAVAAALAAARAITDGRVIAVVGCGGDRDAAKRGPMGRAAALGADVVVLTSDNPRSEDPEVILDAVEAGARAVGTAVIEREADRRRAIAAAIAAATTGDVVVIAGKGHEPYQELADGRIDFDDRLVARAVLEGLT